MARARSARRTFAWLGLAAGALGLAWLVERQQVAAPAAPAPVVAAQPLQNATDATALAEEAVVAGARSAYLAAVLRAPEAGESSRSVAQERRRIFEQEAARLAALGRGAVPLLQAQLRAERNDHARLLLLSALSRVEGEAGARAALDALESLADPTLEALFLDRLVRADDAQSARLLEAVLTRSPRPETRVSLLASAAQRGDQRLAGRLPELALHDESAAVRAQALTTAERLAVPLSPALLEQMAHADPDPALRERALTLLAASDPEALVSYARRSLQGGGADAEQVRALSQALATSPDPEASALLEELAHASDPTLRDAAARALRARSARGSAR